MKSALRIHKRPPLRNPRLVIGWVDTGLIGTNTADYLIDKLGAKEFAEIEPYDFCSLPHSLIKKGVLQEIEYPGNVFYYWRNKKAAGDLIVLSGKPPEVHHYEFANLMLDLAELFAVRRIYTVGGLQADTAHTEKPRVFAVINSPRLKKHVRQCGVELSEDYHGPSSMNGLILGLAKLRDIEGISLWGQVPSYISEIPNLQVCETVLRALTRMLDLDIDFSEIEAEARFANEQIEELVSLARQQNPDLDRHIGKLERGLGSEASEEEKRRFFREIEEFLRKQKGRRESD